MQFTANQRNLNIKVQFIKKRFTELEPTKQFAVVLILQRLLLKDFHTTHQNNIQQQIYICLCNNALKNITIIVNFIKKI